MINTSQFVPLPQIQFAGTAHSYQEEAAPSLTTKSAPEVKAERSEKRVRRALWLGGSVSSLIFVVSGFFGGSALNEWVRGWTNNDAELKPSTSQEYINGQFDALEHLSPSDKTYTGATETANQFFQRINTMAAHYGNEPLVLENIHNVQQAFDNKTSAIEQMLEEADRNGGFENRTEAFDAIMNVIAADLPEDVVKVLNENKDNLIAVLDSNDANGSTEGSKKALLALVFGVLFGTAAIGASIKLEDDFNNDLSFFLPLAGAVLGVLTYVGAACGVGVGDHDMTLVDTDRVHNAQERSYEQMEVYDDYALEQGND